MSQQHKCYHVDNCHNPFVSRTDCTWAQKQSPSTTKRKEKKNDSIFHHSCWCITPWRNADKISGKPSVTAHTPTTVFQTSHLWKITQGAALLPMSARSPRGLPQPIRSPSLGRQRGSICSHCTFPQCVMQRQYSILAAHIHHYHGDHWHKYSYKSCSPTLSGEVNLS